MGFLGKKLVSLKFTILQQGRVIFKENNVFETFEE